MPNKRDHSSGCVPGYEKRTRVQRLFTRIAPRYDYFNRIVSLGLDQGWRKETVRRARLSEADRVLDVCAGTGDLAIMCAKQKKDEGLVVGVDMNRAMLSYAQRKYSPNAASIFWLQSDALALPFLDCCFDRVMIGFSTRNLTDLMAGVREMLRVLRPGGSLLILETGYPVNSILRACYQLFLFTFAPLVGFLFTGRIWPFTYLARSVREFLSPRQVVECLISANTDAQ